MKKKPTVWLARDSRGAKFYHLSICEKPSRSLTWSGAWFGGTDLCPEEFERIAPKSCHLPPGGGPIKIDVKITRRNK